MKAQLLSTATFLTVFTGALPAADPQLLSLVMPDAKVLAGVNVEQAKGTLFGQYVLTQIQSGDHDMQKLVALTGFDPTRDVRETLVASNGAPNSGLALARGNFDVARLTAAANLKGAISENYNGVTILEEPKQTHGVAFLDATTAIGGDIASVKGAIDRQKNPQPLPSAVTVQINQLGVTQDAWALCTVPPSTLAPPQTNAQTKDAQNGQIPPVFQTVQSANGGVKFGNNVVFTGQAQTDTAQNATSLGDLIKLLINLAQMNAGQNQQAAALAKAVQVSASGNTLNVSLSLPEDQFQQLARFGQKGDAVQVRPHRLGHPNSERK
jgi:hypothetical protein